MRLPRRAAAGGTRRWSRALRGGARRLARVRLVAAGGPRGRRLRGAVRRSRRAGWRARTRRKFDEPRRPARRVGDSCSSPLAHWDAVWYLLHRQLRLRRGRRVRPRSSRSTRCSSAAVGELGGGWPAAVLLAAYSVALAAFLAALVLLYRLMALELGRPRAWPAVLLLCVFPRALYFGAPYSESLFLLLLGRRVLRGANRKLGVGRRCGGSCVRHAQRGRAPAVAAGSCSRGGGRAARRLALVRRPGWRSPRSGWSPTPPTSGSPTATRWRSRRPGAWNR